MKHLKVFECQRCGCCCRGEGGIRITLSEIKEMAAYLKMNPETFMSQFVEIKYGYYYLRLKEENGEKVCVFLEKDGCLVHPCKPLPCRLWPFWKGILNSELDWQGVKSMCPGINPNVSYQEFVKEGQKERQRILGNKSDERHYL